MAVKTFSVGEVLTASDTNTYLANSGLVYISSTTIGTAVSTVTVTGLTGYDSYQIVVNNSTLSTAANVSLTLRLGSTNSTTGYYGVFYYSDWNAGTSGQAGDNNAATFTYATGATNTSGFNTIIDLVNMGKANPTTIRSLHVRNIVGHYTGYHSVATAYDGFVISSGGATMTGGTITVYGYRMA